jgi:hypothetical protein
MNASFNLPPPAIDERQSKHEEGVWSNLNDEGPAPGGPFASCHFDYGVVVLSVKVSALL